MFGIRNKTVSFAAKIGAFGVDVAFGFIEEVTFNITSVGEAGAAIIPDNIPTPTVDPFVIRTTSVTAGSIFTSPYVRKKAFEIFDSSCYIESG